MAADADEVLCPVVITDDELREESDETIAVAIDSATAPGMDTITVSATIACTVITVADNEGRPIPSLQAVDL